MSASTKFSRLIRASEPEVRAVLLPPDVTGRLPDGRLPVAIADQDLKVTIELEAPLGLPAYILLLWNGTAVVASKRDITAAENIAGGKIEVKLPAIEMATSGDYTLDYATYTGIGENEEVAHQTLRVIVDRTPPGGATLGPVTFETVPDDFVTAASFDTNDKLAATVPDWFGMYIQDTATAWIAPGRNPVDADWKELPAVFHDVVVAGEEVTLLFNKGDLTQFADGYQSFSYKLKDTLGNVNPNLAPPKVLRVLLSDVPSNILPPIVPAFVDHGLVTFEDARLGLPVQIPSYANPDPTDQFVIFWGNFEAPISDPLGPLPSPLPLPPLPIATVIVGLETVKKMANGPVDVRYRIMRGGIEVGNSTATPIVMDLRTPGGGEDPDPTTPEHENLLNAVVKSSSGELNTIPAKDYNSDGTVTIPRLGVNGNAVWQDGDVVEVSWGPTLKLPPATINNQLTDLVLQLSSANIIQPGPAGHVNVSYTITRQLKAPPDAVNAVARSGVTDVNVVAIGDIPGGGLPLESAKFPEANANNVINQAAGRDGTPVRVLLPITNIVANDYDSITIRFSGVYSTSDQNSPEIPGTQVVLNRTILSEDITRGWYDFPIPAATLTAICQGGAKVEYTAKNSIAEITSGVSFVTISVVTPGYCTIPVQPAP